MGRIASFAFLACVVPCAAGCSALSVGPDRIHTVEVEAAALVAYVPETVPAPNSPELFNYVTERMFEIDLEYSVYFAKLTTDYQLGNLAGDLAILGLTASSTLAPAAVTKTVLSATSTAVTGAKAAIDKDVLLAHTIQILQNQMETSRTHIKNSILASLNDSLTSHTPYTYWEALSDLEAYYRAGTLPGALEALQAATGTNAQNSKNCTTGVTQTSTAANCTTTGGNTQGGTNTLRLAAPVRAGGPAVNSRGARVPALVR
jgi:hypothetical protein